MPFVPVDTSKIDERLAAEKTYRPQSPVVYLKIVNDKMFCVRIMPAWTDEGPNSCLPYLRINQHWNIPGRKLPVNCPKEMSEGVLPCYICEQVEHLRRTGNEKDKKYASDIRSQRSFLYQVVDRDDEIWKKGDDKVQGNEELIGKPKIKILSLRITAWRAINSIICSARQGDITDPVQGRDLEFKRTGSEGSTLLTPIPVPDRSFIFESSPGVPDEKKMMEIEEVLFELDEHNYFQPASYLETVAAITGEKIEDLQKMQEQKQLTASVQPSSPPPAGLLPSPTTSDAGPTQRPTESAHTQTRSLNAAPQQPPAVVQPEQLTKERKLEWLALTKNGLVKTGEEWVKEGVFAKPDHIWCYSLQPSPYDQHCWKCDMVAHCTQTFQAKNGLYFHEGPPLRKTPQPKPDPSSQATQASAPSPEVQGPPPAQQAPEGRNLDDVTGSLTQRSKKRS